MGHGDTRLSMAPSASVAVSSIVGSVIVVVCIVAFFHDGNTSPSDSHATPLSVMNAVTNLDTSPPSQCNLELAKICGSARNVGISQCHECTGVNAIAIVASGCTNQDEINSWCTHKCPTATEPTTIWTSRIGSPLISSNGEILYTMGLDLGLVAMNAKTKAVIWSWNSTGLIVIYDMSLSKDGQTVYLASIIGEFAINALTGSKIWGNKKATAQNPAFSASNSESPAIFNSDDTVMYLENWGQQFVAIDTSDGSQIWSNGNLGGMGDLSTSQHAVLSSDGNTLYAGSNEGYSNPSAPGSNAGVHALNAKTGSVIWQFKCGPVSATPVRSSDSQVLYIGSEDQNLYAIDTSDGSQKWMFYTLGGVHGFSSSPVLSKDGEVVYAISTNGNLYAVNAQSGSKIWSSAIGRAGDVVYSPFFSSSGPSAGNILYFRDWNGKLDALDPSTGSKIWTFDATGGIANPPVFSSDGSAMYLGTWNNKVFALNALTGCTIWSYTNAQFSTQDAAPVLSPNGKVLYFANNDNILYAVNAA